MPTKKPIICAYCHKKIEPFQHKITLYNPPFKPELRRQYYHGDCYTEKVTKNKKDILRFLRLAHKAGLQLSLKRVNDTALLGFLERQGFSKRQINSIWKLINIEKAGFTIEYKGSSNEKSMVSGGNGGVG